MPAPVVVHDVSSPLSSPKPPREKKFQTCLHLSKVSAFEPVSAASSLVEGPPLQPSVPFSDFDVPIALRKDKLSCTDHPISYFVSYDRLTPFFRQFALYLSSVSLLRSYEEAILVPAWKQAMDEEMMPLFLEELESWSLHRKMLLLVVVDGSMPWSIALMVQWIGIRLGLCQMIYSDVWRGLL